MCEHEYQHFKSILQTALKMNLDKPFGLVFYCRKCLEVVVKEYPAINQIGRHKDE